MEKYNSKISIEKNNISNKSMVSIPKIVLITFRNKENINFQPAEEILMEIILEKLNLTYEKIEYGGLQVNDFFGKLPVLYFEGRIILNKHIPIFLKDLVLGECVDMNFNIHFDILLSILKEQLSFCNEYYYYLKQKEKHEKSRSKKIFANFRRFFYSNPNLEKVNDNILNTFPMISTTENMFMSTEEKISTLIKDAFYKIERLSRLEFTNEKFDWLSKVNIYAFLKEDKLFFTKLRRPLIENVKNEDDSMLANLGGHFKVIEENYVKRKSGKIVMNESWQEYAKKHSIACNPSSKKIQNIQQYQAETGFYHQLFSIGIFCSTALFLFYLSSKKNK